jgi:protein-disulfide isomerase
MSLPRLAAAAVLLTAVSACDSGTTTTTESKTGTAAVAAPGGDWTQVSEQTAEGGYRIGNPNADVKIIEYGSVWCPHCKEFHDHAMEPLKKTYIATGKVSYELRNFVLNGADLAATLLVRCGDKATYWRRLETFYARQQEWEMNFINIPEDQQKALQGMPQEQQIVAYAKAAKLNDFVRPQGISEAKFEQCLTDQAEVKRLTDSNNKAQTDFNLTGTPTFIINGVTLQGVGTWETLEPKIKAAL